MSPELPPSFRLPIGLLAACFNNVTNSYKFYWFLAILEHVREDQGRVVPIDVLLARMVADVWYPLNYFRLFLGKQDRLGAIATELGTEAGLPMDSSRLRVEESALAHLYKRDNIGRQIASLAEYVPYRFLRPFFAHVLRGTKDWEVNRRIAALTESAFSNPENPCLYRFVTTPNSGIELHPIWFEYLHEHLTILTGFCLWHLVNYLQKHNPNVPNIAGKLFEPQARNLRQARTFWKIVLEQSEQLICLYTGQPVTKEDFTLDHFLPWRFVAHDQLWNIVPVTKSANSAKGDSLPDLALYFDPFANIQYRALQIVGRAAGATRLLEDYALLFKAGSLSELHNLTFSRFREALYAVIAPQMQIAANMGFATGWRYSP